MSGDTSGAAPATQRAALTLQLVPYLAARGQVAVDEVAADFDVTPEQVREMVRALTTMGLPGDSGYWQMPDDLFDIDWDLLEREDVIALTNVVGLDHAPRLTAREAAALLAGLQLARTLLGDDGEQLVDRLLGKLSRGASSTPAEVVVAPEPVDGVRALVQDALRRGRAVSFTYHAPDAPATTRTVDPVEVVIADGQWYVRGWCHLRRAMRTFHLDRVADAVVTDIVSTHRPESAGTVFDRAAFDRAALDRAALDRAALDRAAFGATALDARTPGDTATDDRGTAGTVLLRVPARSIALLGGYADGARIARDADDGATDDDTLCTVRIRVAGPNSLKRVVTGLGGDAEIVAPADARRAVNRWAAQALAQYGPEADDTAIGTGTEHTPPVHP